MGDGEGMSIVLGGLAFFAIGFCFFMLLMSVEFYSPTTSEVITRGVPIGKIDMKTGEFHVDQSFHDNGAGVYVSNTGITIRVSEEKIEIWNSSDYFGFDIEKTAAVLRRNFSVDHDLLELLMFQECPRKSQNYDIVNVSWFRYEVKISFIPLAGDSKICFWQEGMGCVCYK